VDIQDDGSDIIGASSVVGSSGKSSTRADTTKVHPNNPTPILQEALPQPQDIPGAMTTS
jgi:hypothetical protein